MSLRLVRRSCLRSRPGPARAVQPIAGRGCAPPTGGELRKAGAGLPWPPVGLYEELDGLACRWAAGEARPRKRPPGSCKAGELREDGPSAVLAAGEAR